MELETHLSVAAELLFLSELELEPLATKTRDVGKMLNRLIQALKKPYHPVPNP
jgi:hypothetical protein